MYTHEDIEEEVAEFRRELYSMSFGRELYALTHNVFDQDDDG